METHRYWEDNAHPVKYDNYNSNDGLGRGPGEQLNFATAPSEDEADYPSGAYLKKGKVSRQDPMSHRIIEKRRRDRMNNCLADLSRLIPPEYLKKGRGRVEKTEIIEMAIRHIKFLQERVNAGAQGAAEHWRAGFQEALGEAARYLADALRHAPADQLCLQLTSHLQRHCEIVIKGEAPRRDSRAHLGSSSETNSSSSSSLGYSGSGALQRPEPPAFARQAYEPDRQLDTQYAMDCDRVIQQVPLGMDSEPLPEDEPLPLDGRRKREPMLRKVRKLDHKEDYLHSYKFKNSIERRFSRSQDSEAAEAQAHGKAYSHKRRRAPKQPPPPVSTSTSTSTSTSASGSAEEARDTSPQDTSSESPHHHHYDKLPPRAQYVPVFALNSLGKYYVPLSVEYACLARHLGPYDALDARAAHLAAPLHPVTIHVNFQSCVNYHVKREPGDHWRQV